jgi:hypothetical protein
LFRIYKISLLFKDIICFYVALYIEHMPIILMRTRIEVSPHKNICHQIPQYQKHKKTISHIKYELVTDEFIHIAKF